MADLIYVGGLDSANVPFSCCRGQKVGHFSHWDQTCISPDYINCVWGQSEKQNTGLQSYTLVSHLHHNFIFNGSTSGIVFYSPTTGLIKPEQCFCFSKYPCQTAGSHYGYLAVGGQNISQMFEMSNGQACHFHLLSCWDVDSQSTHARYVSGKPNPISSLTPQ